jgi:CCR4-NOT transcription complex subunit 1
VASEQVVLLLVQDNLDVACSAIEKAAMERAITDIDDGFATSYDVRRRHREVLLILSDILKVI